jgi:glycosyltransferase involved in cell wall biosynthesis
MTWLTIDGGPAENRHRARGIGVFVRALATSLNESDVDPDVGYLSCRPIGPVEGRWHARSPLARLTGVDRRVPGRVAAIWKFVDTAWGLPHDVRRTGAAVFLATDPHAIAIDRRFSTVAMVYDFIPLIFPDQYLRGARATLLRMTVAAAGRRLRRAAGFVAISNATRNDARRFLGIDPSRIRVVPLAVDHARFHPGAIDGRISLTGSAPYLLYVGEADPRKNVKALVDAFLDLPMTDLHLVLAGGSTQTRERLRAMCHGEGAGRIHLLGAMDDQALAALYAGALAFVFPSVYEGFGLPVLEAMACGAPVICSRGSALQEVAGQAALFTDPGRPEALREAIARVTAEPSLRAELRGRGLERAATFTWSATRDGIIEACQSCR